MLSDTEQTRRLIISEYSFDPSVMRNKIDNGHDGDDEDSMKRTFPL